MKKFIASLLVVFMGTSMAFAQEVAEENPNAPIINFEQKTIDYGTIEKGADGNKVFTFTNSGKEPLILKSVRASCGCTTPNWTREPISPGESGSIKVHYDTNRMNNFTKTITVESNAGNGRQTLIIKGKVVAKPEEPTTPTKESGSKVSK